MAAEFKCTVEVPSGSKKPDAKPWVRTIIARGGATSTNAVNIVDGKPALNPKHDALGWRLVSSEEVGGAKQAEPRRPAAPVSGATTRRSIPRGMRRDPEDGDEG